MNTPIFFERNRVGRVYTGGKLFADLFGDEPMDGYLPEEWIASNVKALNKEMRSEREGVSRLENSDVYFDDALKESPESMLGPGGELRILVKGLDSAIRLPAQAHPDKEFSKKHFNSLHGKTECWIILDKRAGAKLYFGFKDGVTKEDFEKAIDDSAFDMDAMERLMESIVPEVGDVYMVPARTVHAIGKGCLILEVQEPTDFTIQPEHFCGEYELDDNQMYLGLDRETAVSCFDFTQAPDTKMKPEVVDHSDGMIKESLVTEKDTDCFIINRIKLTGGDYTPDVKDSYAIYIITDGEGKLSGEDYSRDINKGDYFFMPYSLMGKYKLSGNMTVVECW